MNHKIVLTVLIHRYPTEFSIFNTNTLLQSACNLIEINCSNDISRAQTVPNLLPNCAYC